VAQIPPSSEPPATQGSTPPYDPRWLGPPPAGWWPGYPPAQRAQPPGWVPLKVQVWAAVEIALGALLIGGILVSQASWTTYSGSVSGQYSSGQFVSGAPWYATAYAYAAGVLLAITLGLAIRALLSPPTSKIGRLRASQLAVAAAAFALAGGYTLMTQIAGWTGTCSLACTPGSPGLSVNTVVSNIAVDAGAGLVAALLPVALWLWCRARAEQPVLGAPPPPPNWPAS
jgi:hypothetical protein